MQSPVVAVLLSIEAAAQSVWCAKTETLIGGGPAASHHEQTASFACAGIGVGLVASILTC